MQIIDNKALLLRVKQPEHLLASLDKAAHVGPNDVLVKWTLDQVQRLRKMGIKAPSPIEGRYDWPGKFKPMAHQRTTASFLTLNKRSFCFSEQGTGKTASAIWAADYLMKIGLVRRVLIICPVSIMDVAWRADLFSFAMHRTVGIAHGTAEKRRKVLAQKSEFVVINFDGVEVVQKELARGDFDLIIVDECFVAGTQVLTPSGNRPIESLGMGDEVCTSSGVKRIKTTTNKVSTDIVEVKLSNGERIRCTGDHPFFTDAGWLSARNLAGRRLISASALSDMRERVRRSTETVAVAPQEGDEQAHHLLQILCTEEAPCDQPRNVILSSDAGKRAGHTTGHNANGRATESPVGEIAQNRPQATSANGKRVGNDTFGEDSARRAARELGLELPRSVGEKAAGLSYLLQARLREPREKDRLGGGWRQPQIFGAQSAGSKENSEAGGSWVESVSHIECASGEIVYNIEVEGTPNYFVGSGHLVHNCNAYKNAQSKRWKVLKNLIQELDDPWLWMMTGTPAAQGPEDAYGIAKLVNPTGVPRTFGSFRDMVMIKVSQFRWEARPESPEIVHRVLQPAIRFTKQECLDLPDLVYVKREVELTKQQRKYYELIRKELLMEAAGSVVTAVNAAVQMNKLLQVACGAVYDTEGNTLEFDIRHRYSVLLEAVSEAAKKVLVFVPFTNVIDVLAEKLKADGYEVDIIRGDVPVSRRTEIFNRFQREKSPHILLIQPQAAAHGVTLTAADTVVWWGPVSSLETYAQANARAHRSGQTHKCTVVQLQGSPVERRLYALLDKRVEVNTRLVDLYKEVLD